METLLCLLTNLPGPPLIHFQNLTFQLYPINKIICPNINPDTDVIYELYTRKNPGTPNIIKLDNDSLLQASNIDFTISTIIYIHGFMDSSKSVDAQSIKDNYLEKDNYNVILVDIERLLAAPFYMTAVQNVLAIGKYTAKFIDFLVTKGLKLSNLHIIGMSLGAQIAGIAGSSINSGIIGRITGLDPAGIVFNNAPNNIRLDKSDAEFVDIIHTNGDVNGYPFESGHADFWVNGGDVFFQPGCHPGEVFRRNPGSISELVLCSHWRSYQIYAESVNRPTEFPARKCLSWKDFQMKKCDSNELQYIGSAVNKTARGNYYISTSATALYIE